MEADQPLQRLSKSYLKELGVSSLGDSPDDPRAALQEAVATFLEGCALLGAPTEVLQESEFEMLEGAWRLRERMTVCEVA